MLRRRMPRASLAMLLCIVACVLHVTEAAGPGKDCAKTVCTNKTRWGGFVKDTNGAKNCPCSDGPTCDCFQGEPNFFLCLSLAGDYLVGNPAVGDKCGDQQYDCRNCPTTPSIAPTTTPLFSSITATPGGKPSPSSSSPNNLVPGATTTNPAAIPMDTTLAMWQVALAIASGVLMLVVLVCVLVSWRKACTASRATDKHAHEDARFYRDNYRSQTFQQSHPPQTAASHRRSSLAQSMLIDQTPTQQPRAPPPPVVSF